MNSTVTTQMSTLSLHDALPIFEAGPNAVLAFAREGYRKTDVNLRDLYDALSYAGLWNFLGRHSRMCRSEEHTSELQSHSELVCRLLLEKKNSLAGEQ